MVSTDENKGGASFRLAEVEEGRPGSPLSSRKSSSDDIFKLERARGLEGDGKINETDVALNGSGGYLDKEQVHQTQRGTFDVKKIVSVLAVSTCIFALSGLGAPLAASLSANDTKAKERRLKKVGIADPAPNEEFKHRSLQQCETRQNREGDDIQHCTLVTSFSHIDKVDGHAIVEACGLNNVVEIMKKYNDGHSQVLHNLCPVSSEYTMVISDDTWPSLAIYDDNDEAVVTLGKIGSKYVATGLKSKMYEACDFDSDCQDDLTCTTVVMSRGEHYEKKQCDQMFQVLPVAPEPNDTVHILPVTEPATTLATKPATLATKPATTLATAVNKPATLVTEPATTPATAVNKEAPVVVIYETEPEPTDG